MKDETIERLETVAAAALADGRGRAGEKESGG